MATLRLEIVTPTASAYSDDVDMVVVPGVEGELGVLPLHVPLLTQIAPGVVRIIKGGQETDLVLGNGFAQITRERVEILTDMASAEQDIDEGAAEEAIRRAEEALRNQQPGGDEAAEIHAALARSAAQLQFKRRRRGST
jgi:F-type H+-transporting ATPase subunit epsilon